MERAASKTSPVPFYVLIPAAGKGTRLGGDIPKQYQDLKGKTVLRQTLEAFLSCPGLQELRVIIDPAHRALYDQAVHGLDLPEPVEGSDERNRSVYKGIKSFFNLREEDILLIHDAARPFIEAEEILSVVHTLQEKQAATLAVPVSDTLRREDGSYIDRNGAWSVQTPQGFHYGVICKAHENTSGNLYTDDTQLVTEMGIEVAHVPGKRSNFKITTAEDMAFAQQMVGSETRSATGFDVHAFTDKPGDLRICGVDIPHNRTLSGHSDADVGWHALTDALLGTVAAGDIGSHFPPSDPQWQDAESALFLKYAADLVAQKSGQVIHCDLTLICEEPKIGPYRKAMQAKTAKILGLAPDRISIKATTTEKLGFTGRGEGIAAQAIVSVAF